MDRLLQGDLSYLLLLGLLLDPEVQSDREYLGFHRCQKDLWDLVLQVYRDFRHFQVVPFLQVVQLDLASPANQSNLDVP